MAIVDPARWFLPAEMMPRSPHFTTGNAVTALVDGMNYFADLQRTIADCDDSLLIAGWRVSGEQRLNPSLVNGALAGEKVVDAVTAAARRGCSVKALLWSAIPLGAAMPDKLRLWHAGDNVTFARAVKAAGGDAILDNRLSIIPGSSHHQKYVVATFSDPKRNVAYVGGIDLCYDRWDRSAHDGAPERQTDTLNFGTSAHDVGTTGWHDVQTKVQGPAIIQLWQTFRARWNDPRPANLVMPLSDYRGATQMSGVPPQAGVVGTCAVQVRQTLPAGIFPETGGVGEKTLALAHERAFDLAEHYIYIEDQFFWPCSLVEKLEAALQRGVHVLLVVARDDSTPPPPIAKRLRHAVVERLRKAGGSRFQIFHLERADGRQIFVHSKLIIVDDCYASIGSANFNGRSLTNDTEIEIGVVDTELVETDMGAKRGKVCRFAHELRRRLWAEHFECGVQDIPDPIAALARFAQAPGKRAHPHVVHLGALDLDPIAEYITTIVTENVIPVPHLPLPPGVNERSVVKFAVNAMLRGPQSALLFKFLEEFVNPDLAPALASIGRPVAIAWREVFALRAAHAMHFVGKHSPVTEADLAGQEFIESRHGVSIFRLNDGRYHVVSHFAVPSIEAARAAAIAVSGDLGEG